MAYIIYRTGTSVKLISDNYSMYPRAIHSGETGTVIDYNRNGRYYKICLDKDGLVIDHVPFTVVEISNAAKPAPPVLIDFDYAKAFGLDPDQIVAPPTDPHQGIVSLPISKRAGMPSCPITKTQFSNSHGLASSLGPVEEPESAIGLHPDLFTSYHCTCGASSVGVEKHDDVCPRKAIEHLVMVKQ